MVAVPAEAVDQVIGPDNSEGQEKVRAAIAALVQQTGSIEKAAAALNITDAEIDANIDGWLQEYQPDVVLLHLGTNNVRHYDSAAGTAGKVAALVASIRAQRPHAHIFVAKIIGTRDPLLHKL